MMGFGRKWKNWGDFAAKTPLYAVTWEEEGEPVPVDVPEEAGSQLYILESDLIETLVPFGWPNKVSSEAHTISLEASDEEGWVVPIFHVGLKVYAGDPQKILNALHQAGYSVER